MGSRRVDGFFDCSVLAPDRRLGSRRVDGEVDFLAVVGLELGSVLTFSYVDLCVLIARTTTKVNVHFSSVLFILFILGSEKEKREVSRVK